MKTSAVASVVALALLVSGCGPASAPPEPRAAESGTAASPSRTAQAPLPRRSDDAAKPRFEDPRNDGFEVAFGEFAVVPEAGAIRPGRVELVVMNGGKLTHGFEMKSEGGSNRGHGHGDRFEVEGPLFGSGDTYRVSVQLSPGLYEMECYVGNHEELGMRTLLEVRADAPLVRAADASPNRVAIKGFSFGPKTVTVPVGTRITWRNDDPAQHTVTARDGSFGSDPLAQGGSYAVRFSQAGTHEYFCAIHPDMKGTVRVTA